MSSKLNPYISFRNNAREAMTFYQSVFGGKLDISTFKDYQMAQDPSEENLVMHAQLSGDNGMTLMGADTPARMPYQPGNNIAMSLSGENEAELSGYYKKLAEGGTVLEPLVKAPWGDTFGMLTDKFGITWMVNIAGKQP